MRRLLPPSLVLLLGLAVLAAWLLVPASGVPGPLRLLGAVVAVGGLAVTVAGSRLFERVDTNIKTFDDPDHLVVTGLYALSRNPMYLGFLLLLAGLAMALPSMAAPLGPLAFYLAADRWYIRFEERRLVAVFGPDYDRYRQRVRRWIGRRPVPAEPLVGPHGR